MFATSAFLIVFRIVHIVAGVAWGGSVVMLVLFVQPAAASIAPAAGPFMMELLGKRKVVNAILGMAGVTIVGGMFLYWHDWHLYPSLGDWLGSRQGLVLTIGAVAAIVAFLIGLFGTRPGVQRLMALMRQVAESGGAPPPEIAQEIPSLQARLRVLARTSLALIVIAVLAMATARYW